MTVTEPFTSRWRRRAITIPVMLAGTVAGVVASPVIFAVAVAMDVASPVIVLCRLGHGVDMVTAVVIFPEGQLFRPDRLERATTRLAHCFTRD